MNQKNKNKLLGLVGMLLVLLLIGTSTQSVASNSDVSVNTGQIQLDGLNINAETVILSVDTFDIYLPEFKFWLKYIQNYYQNYMSEALENWDEEETGMTVNEFYFTTAAGYAVKDRAIEVKAKELGLGLKEEDKASIEKTRNDNIKIYGGLSEYLRIVSSMYISESVFQYLTKIDYLGNYLFKKMYGANGEKCTDDEVQAYIDVNNLNCIRYVCLSNTDEDGAPLSSIKIKNNYTLVEYDLKRLGSSDNPEALFDDLTNEYDEAIKTSSYPDGLLFAEGTMDAELEDAFQGLDVYEYSDIVETSTGYYIIMRMPVTLDMVVDSSGETLRYMAAYNYYFKNKIEALGADMKIKYSDAYYQLLEDSY